MKQAALLIRVSTATQNFERQISDLKQLATQMGYKVSDDFIYAEKISGFKKIDDRLELNKLINDIKSKKKKIDMIFTTEISRIARNPIIGRKIIDEITELGVPVYIQNLKMATLNEDGSRNSMFSIFFQILIEFAHTEAEYTKVRMKSGKIQSIKEGRNHGGEYVVYGYLKNKIEGENKAGKLIVNKDEADVVKTVYKMYLNGSGMKIIANYLNDNNIKTRTGVPWQVGTVSQMLKNEIYYGSRLYKGEMYDGIVPPIVTKKKWDKVQKVSGERNINTERNVKYLYLLKHKVKCGYCGSYYIPKFRPKKHSHYMCGKRYSGFKPNTCVGCGIGIDKIESVSWFIVKSNLKLFPFIGNKEYEVTKNKSELNNLKMKLKTYQNEIEQKNEEKRKWQRLFVLDRVNENELNNELNKLDTTIKNLNDKVKITNEEIDVKMNWVTKFENLHTYTSLVKDAGNDRIKINQIIPEVLRNMTITSVSKGSLSDLFIITTSLYSNSDWTYNSNNKEQYTSILYNKRTMEVYTSEKGSKMIKYEKGIINSNVEKISQQFLKDNNKVKIDLVPFTRLNVLNEMKVVPNR